MSMVVIKGVSHMNRPSNHTDTWMGSNYRPGMGSQDGERGAGLRGRPLVLSAGFIFLNTLKTKTAKH